MTAAISQVSHQEALMLISTMDGGKLTYEEIELFSRFVFISSMVWEGIYDNELVCLWGVIPPTLLSDRAYLWLHTTEAAQKHVFVLVRRSQIEIAKILKQYPVIVGHCEVGADHSIRWLKWLGAKFGEPEGKMIPFTIRGKE